VVKLISAEDEEIRRTAIEILNSTKSDRAEDHLIKATDDSDWWVRERAIDALSKMGSTKVLPKLETMLGQNPKTDTVIVRALAKLGNHNHISKILPMLKRPEREIQVEAIKAISQLTNDSRADSVRNLLKKIKQSDDEAIINAADKALKSLDARFSETVMEQNARAEKIAENKTMLVDNEDLEKLLQAAKEESAVARADDDGEVVPVVAASAPAVLDISKLTPGDIIDGRYKYIEKIGKGAFGTVLLMEDEVVDEQGCR
jgi:serine/threonine-protein kinase